ncbi:PPC domain-containing protein [Limnochorda pilosa]|uniref:Peptidase C-terminal archaeal/bacterial domain-containing protein n=1 Tax=Limnochorda pilosa TaxID=1555112 RepID=A0A0K2SHT8_LIMPI|nr:PPC domain-containing protein [Limnochorda pilosa]BAS26607.1 hypothetical protein LIP_0750 [Limnochorda pilosa]
MLLVGACAGLLGSAPVGLAAAAASGAGDAQAVPAGGSASWEAGAAGPADELVPGRSLERAFTVQDPRLDDDSPFHAYWFEARRGQRIELVMRSDEVDPYLWLYGPGGELLAGDDDSGPGPYDAAIRAQAPQDGTYRVLANTALGWQRGRYSLSLRLEDPPAGGPPGRDGAGAAGDGAGAALRARPRLPAALEELSNPVWGAHPGRGGCRRRASRGPRAPRFPR